MKTLSLSCLVGAFIFAGCATKSNTESVASDTTAIQTTATGTVSVSSSAYQAPEEIVNFPEYNYESTLSDDQREKEITEAVDELVYKLNSLSLLRFSSYFKKQRDYNGDYGDVSESTEETETWFFDRNYKLRGYSKKYYRDGEGRDTRVTVIIYQGDSIVAVSEYRVDDGQIGVTYHAKMLASKCPECGIKTEKEADSEGNVRAILTRENFTDYQPEYTKITSLADAINMDKAVSSDDVYTFSENVESWSDGQQVYQNPFSIDYTIDKDLFTYIQFGNFIDLFNAGSAQSISPAAVELYLDVPEENTVFQTESMLEDETVYFLLYTKMKMVGGGIYECYATTMSKDGQVLSNVLIGSSYEVTGPDSPGEEYSYEYDTEKKVLMVTQTTINPSENGDDERTEKKYNFKLNKDGTIAAPVVRE
jgi:hypothetical protein